MPISCSHAGLSLSLVGANRRVLRSRAPLGAPSERTCDRVRRVHLCFLMPHSTGMGLTIPCRDSRALKRAAST
jgi:hypothetical protein